MPSSPTLLAMVGKVSSYQGCGGELGDGMRQLRGPEGRTRYLEQRCFPFLTGFGQAGW